MTIGTDWYKATVGTLSLKELDWNDLKRQKQQRMIQLIKLCVVQYKTTILLKPPPIGNESKEWSISRILPQKKSAHLHHSREYHIFHANSACRVSQPSENGVRVKNIIFNNFNPLQEDPTANKLFHLYMSLLKEARISVTLFSFHFALYPQAFGALITNWTNIRRTLPSPISRKANQWTDIIFTTINNRYLINHHNQRHRADLQCNDYCSLFTVRERK